MAKVVDFSYCTRRLTLMRTVKVVTLQSQARLLGLGLLWLATVRTPGQVTGIHQFNGIYRLSDQTTALDLGGSVP
jgi:hypothetical protein